MIYFNGFSLTGEESLFEDFLLSSESCVAGFSYGAQRAFEYVYKSSERIDRLILLSPAFFQTEKPSFIRTQLRYFDAGQEAYVKQFISNVAYPSSLDISKYLEVGRKDELDALLSYTWDKDKINKILDRGTTIEVFFGVKDKIIDIKAANEFFSMTVNYLLKDAGHLLRELL